MSAKSVKKVMEESRNRGYEEIDLQDKGITNVADVPYLLNMRNITILTLSHNRITKLPDAVANLTSLENLNLFNNDLETLPLTICNLPKLRFLNCGINKLREVPKGFGACPTLEVLDLTYNNLTDASFPGNFFYLAPLRALYLGDNDFEVLPPAIKNLVNLQILVVRDNDLISIPKEIGELTKLKELNIQNNRLTVLPPELGYLDLVSPKHMLKADNNPWIKEIADQLVLGTSHVLTYLRTTGDNGYQGRYEAVLAMRAPPPPKKEREKNLKRKKEEKKK